MKLNELLNLTNYPTDIALYESSSESWDASKETLIKKDITVSDYYNNDDCIKELYDKYKNYEVIGIATEANTLRITVYKGTQKKMKKKIGDLTLREIVKEHKNRNECNGCPYDSNHLTNDYKTHLCRISCSNSGLDLDKEIEVEDDE